jgi:hypothetical protein
VLNWGGRKPGPVVTLDTHVLTMFGRWEMELTLFLSPGFCDDQVRTYVYKCFINCKIWLLHSVKAWLGFVLGSHITVKYYPKQQLSESCGGSHTTLLCKVNLSPMKSEFLQMLSNLLYQIDQVASFALICIWLIHERGKDNR